MPCTEYHRKSTLLQLHENAAPPNPYPRAPLSCPVPPKVQNYEKLPYPSCAIPSVRPYASRDPDDDDDAPDPAMCGCCVTPEAPCKKI